MIRFTVIKPNTEEFQKWETKAELATKQAIQDWENAKKTRAALKKFFSRKNRTKSLYKEQVVQEALRQQYKKKCAFCDRKLLNRDVDIEHFRPKERIDVLDANGQRHTITITVTVRGRTETVNHPGYYWLAYSWENLLLACSGCNQRLKQCLFPLVDEATRAVEPDRESLESELLIHPGQIAEDLSKHFRAKANGILKPLTSRAYACERLFRLNDSDLVDLRAERYRQAFRDSREVYEAEVVPAAKQPNADELAERKQRLDDARRGDLEFAAAARAGRRMFIRCVERRHRAYLRKEGG